MTETHSTEKNVLGTPLQIAGIDPIKGYLRNGFCCTGVKDKGKHVVAAVVTDEFLEFTFAIGNNLITPLPIYNFPGLKAGDTWCLCASRWKEALLDGCAPPVILEATHEKALLYVTLAELKANEFKNAGRH